MLNIEIIGGQQNTFNSPSIMINKPGNESTSIVYKVNDSSYEQYSDFSTYTSNLVIAMQTVFSDMGVAQSEIDAFGSSITRVMNTLDIGAAVATGDFDNIFIAVSTMAFATYIAPELVIGGFMVYGQQALSTYLFSNGLSNGLSIFEDYVNQNAEVSPDWPRIIDNLNLASQMKVDPNANTNFINAANWTPPRDPLALDLDGDGIETISQNVGIMFDLDADGIKTGTSWLGKDDGWLVLDKNGNGVIDNGTELFGDAYIKANGEKAKNGYDALSDLDSNHDRLVDANDAQFSQLKVWQDANSDGISQAGELKSLSQLGVTALSTGAVMGDRNLGNGVVAIGSGVFSVNDRDAVTASLNLSQNPFYREFGDKLDTSSVATMPDMIGSGSVRDLREAMTLSGDLQQSVTDFMTANSLADRNLVVKDILTDWAATSAMRTAYDDHHDISFAGVDKTSQAHQVWLDKLAVVEKKFQII